MKTTVRLPYYVGQALVILPEFLGAIGEDTFEIRSLEFDPDYDEERQSDAGHVEFKGNTKQVVFNVCYEPGEEGTPGSLSNLIRVSYIRYLRGELTTWSFVIERHYCGCRHCSIRYFFIPGSIEYGDHNHFTLLTQPEQHQIIREFLAKKPISQEVAS